MNHDVGGDCWHDDCSNMCHDFAESAVPLAQPLLGGIDSIVHHPPAAQRQGWGCRLSHKPRLIIKLSVPLSIIRGVFETLSLFGNTGMYTFRYVIHTICQCFMMHVFYVKSLFPMYVYSWQPNLLQ